MSILFCIICLVVGLALSINLHRFVLVEYNIDDEVSKIILKRNKALSNLLNCDKIWNIKEYEDVTYARVNAEAGRNVKRENAYMTYKKTTLFKIGK